MKINNFQNRIFIRNLCKAYTEGVYADTPQNRKLGRVGMTYKQAKEKKEKYDFNLYQLDLALASGIRFNYFNKYHDFEFSLYKDIEDTKDLNEKVSAIIQEYKNSSISNLNFIELSSYIEEEAKKLMNDTKIAGKVYSFDSTKTRKTINLYEGGEVKIGLVFESEEIDDYDEEGNNFPYTDQITLQRTFKKLRTGELVAYHDEFSMNQVYQKRGFSKKILKKLFDEYKKMGVDEVKLCANMTIGGYCWAKYGFMTHIDNIHPILEEGIFNKSITKEQKEEIIDLVLKESIIKDGSRLFPMNLIAELPYGKNLLKGSSWQGVMDLHDKRQMSIFNDYLDYKE